MNSTLYTLNCFLNGPNMQVFSHAGPTCLVYLLPTGRSMPCSDGLLGWSRAECYHLDTGALPLGPPPGVWPLIPASLQVSHCKGHPLTDPVQAPPSEAAHVLLPGQPAIPEPAILVPVTLTGHHSQEPAKLLLGQGPVSGIYSHEWPKGRRRYDAHRECSPTPVFHSGS